MFDPKFKICDDVDYVIEEKANEFSAFRKVTWSEDEAKARFEIRRWRNTPTGEEIPAKGFTFLTEEGPSELLYTMLEHGIGDPKKIIRILRERGDVSEETLKEDILFDPKSLVED